MNIHYFQYLQQPPGIPQLILNLWMLEIQKLSLLIQTVILSLLTIAVQPV